MTRASFVGESHGAERKFLVRALTEIIRESVSVTAEENEFASPTVPKFAKPLGEGV